MARLDITGSPLDSVFKPMAPVMPALLLNVGVEACAHQLHLTLEKFLKA